MTDKNKTSDLQKKIERTVNDANSRMQESLEKTYEDVLDRLKDEKERLEVELKHEYRNARRYVRANPERGVGAALLTGLVVGVLLGRSLK